MNKKLLITFQYLLTEKDSHFIYISSELFRKYKYLILLLVYFNKNYKTCIIYRKKHKKIKNFVVVGLKNNGKKVCRKTKGIAKDFVRNHRNITCPYCGCKMTENNATADHIIPISKGGNNSQVNIIICCSECNNDRGNMDFYRYLNLTNPNRNKYI